MKNKILINLISTLLISTFFTTIISTSAHYPNCDRLNEYGQFDNEACAIADSVNRISNGEKFIKLTNVGEHSRAYYDLLFFDSSEISKILSEITYEKNVDQILAEKEHNVKRNNKIITGSILTTGLGGALYKILKESSKNTAIAVYKNVKDNPRNKGFFNIQNFSIMAIATGISSLLSVLACSINKIFAHQDKNKFLDRARLNKNDYFLTLKLILNDINRLKPGKILSLRFRSPDDEWVVGDEHPSALVRVLDKKSSEDISIDEQNKFDEDLKKLKEDITTILDER